VRRRAAVVLLAAAAVVIGGCGGGSDGDTSTAGGTEAAGERITVVGKEFSYDPAALTLEAGQPFTIVLRNTGSIEHDITVDDAKFKLTVPGDNTREKGLRVAKPGTYQFYCSLPGHKSAGMKGELTVTQPAGP
jgi:uncharacterized cupredoxin-like copper-binding protein